MSSPDRSDRDPDGSDRVVPPPPVGSLPPLPSTAYDAVSPTAPDAEPPAPETPPKSVREVSVPTADAMPPNTFVPTPPEVHSPLGPRIGRGIAFTALAFVGLILVAAFVGGILSAA